MTDGSVSPATRPHLTAWMERANPSHPLINDLESSDRLLGRTLDVLDQLLAEVDAAAPAGLANKRKVFRQLRTDQALLEMRLEIAIGAMLYRAGIPFDLDNTSTSGADLQLRDRPLGIEITAKTSLGVPDLCDELDALFREVPRYSAHLRFSEFPLRMQPHERTRLLGFIRQKALDGRPTRTGGVVAMSFSDRRNGGEITVEADVLPVPALGREGLPFTIESLGPELGPAMEQIEKDVLAIMDEPGKAKQGRAGDAVLVVDVARYGHAWLRDVETWAQRIAHALPSDCPFIALAITVADIHEVDVPLTFALRPELPADKRDLLAGLVADLRSTSRVSLADRLA